MLNPNHPAHSILPVYAADPDALISGDRYYLYPTHGGIYESMQAFDSGQTGDHGHGFAAWSSANLRDWQSEGRIVRFAEISWAQDLDRAWAPCTVQRNGRTYFYFCAADRIGVLVGDTPLGPFTDPIGAPLVPYRSDLSAIDPMVFTADDGQSYLFWGAVPAEWLREEVTPIRTHLSVQKLGSDMISLSGEEVPTLWTVPDERSRHGFGPHMEASHVIQRNGPDGVPIYYLMYSQGSWSNPNDEFLYHVRYATAAHPLGPWTKQPDVTLSTRRDLGIIGTGHHCTVQIPGTDDWFILYHWHKGDCDRRISAARMKFGPQGEILPTELTPTLPEPKLLALGLQLNNFGPFPVGHAVELEIITQREFARIEFFDGTKPLATLEGKASLFRLPPAEQGFHRVWARGETSEGGFLCSAALDFDVL